MADQHDKETDPITSGNRMTKDEIAGRDPQNHAEVPEKSKDEKESKHPDQEQDRKQNEEASSEEAPDLSHASDEDGDVQPSDDDNQQDKE